MSKSQEVQREPWSPDDDIRAVEDQFQFSELPTPELLKVLGQIQRFGRVYAAELARLLPEGTAKQVAINSVLASILWARQSLTSRQIEVVVAADRRCRLDTDNDGNCPSHPKGCPSPDESTGPQ